MDRQKLGKWQIVWHFSKDFRRLDSGWRTATVGVIKVHTPPPEGVYIDKRYYKGLLLRWRYWLPFERGN